MDFKNFIITVILLFETVNADNETSKENVTFFLYTRNNPETPQQLSIDDKQILSNSNFNTNSATKFVSHGWHGTHTTPFYTPIRDSFLTRDNYNVIFIDWSPISKLDYMTAIKKVKYIGGQLAKMIDFLEGQGNDPNRMTLVGHSLGAHVVGSAGHQAKKKVSQIVGLDPAGPLFGSRGAGFELTKNDAQLVEAIHTNTAKLGIKKPIGHVDFYPNGGENQPFCKYFTDKCSHMVVVSFYAEAITEPDKWLGISCTSYDKFTTDKCKDSTIIPFPSAERIEKAHGVVMMRTSDSSPYGLGIEGTRPSSAR